jgi:hypothetical protein
VRRDRSDDRVDCGRCDFCHLYRCHDDHDQPAHDDRVNDNDRVNDRDTDNDRTHDHHHDPDGIAGP